MAKHNTSVILDPWIRYTYDGSVNTMPDTNKTLEYCYVCMVQLGGAVKRVLLRPLKDSGERSGIALIDRRVTMCQTHADLAVASGDYALVEAAPARIKG